MADRIETLSSDGMADLKRKAEQFSSVRRYIGYAGLVLPIIIVIHWLVFNNPLKTSISAYYYSSIGDFFVGALAAMGVFLISYLGYEQRNAPSNVGFWDRITDWQVSTVAGLAALLVAIFPVAPPNDMNCTGMCAVTGITGHNKVIHYFAAGLFFGCTAVFCLVLFPRGTSGTEGRRRYFRACGMLIVAAMIGIAILAIVGYLRGTLNDPDGDPLRLFLWFEVIAVLAFAAAWLEKGRARFSPARPFR